MTAIDVKYADPAVQALLGLPTGPEGAALGGGSYRHYERGSIYYSPATGAHEIHGDIHAKYEATGWERGPLGYPGTDETGIPGSDGRFNHFERGSIYWTPNTGAHEVHGPIHDAWSVNGWEAGSGFPVTDVIVAPDFANIELCRFERAVIAVPSIAPARAFIAGDGINGINGALLVVAPNNDFVAAAQDFIAHKRATGIPTFLHVLSATDANDLTGAPHQLKGIIAEAATYLHVRWVLLLGDTSLIPTRHRAITGIPAGHLTTTTYVPTDLYYSDFWAAGQPVVAVPTDSAPTWINTTPWDHNGNMLYNEQHWANDAADYNPGQVLAQPVVAIGRVPAHTTDEAAAYLAKVVAYETQPPTGIHRMALLTDYNYYNDNGGLYLGQQLLAPAGGADYAVDSVGLGWPANGRPLPDGVRMGGRWATRQAATSSAVVAYIGHGAVGEWAVPGDNFAHVDNSEVGTLRNGANLPVVLAAGCATSPLMQNAPEEGSYRGIDNHTHNYSMSGNSVTDNSVPGSVPANAPINPVAPAAFDDPASAYPNFARGWLLNPDGGAVAYIGESVVQPDIATTEFFGYLLAGMGPGAILGNAFWAAQRAYQAANAASQDVQSAPRIYLSSAHLFGDPSLRLY